MKYVINEELCVQKGMSVEELLLSILVKGDVNIIESLTKMVEKKILIPKEEPGKYFITQRWDNTVSEIILNADTEIPKVEDIESLAIEMARLFPCGIKPGTNIYWKGNKKDTVQKLQKFFKLYGQYTLEDVLNATKYYVEKNKNNLTTMRVLKYFILKDNESDLATTLENMNQPDDTNQLTIDWETELR